MRTLFKCFGAGLLATVTAVIFMVGLVTLAKMVPRPIMNVFMGTLAALGIGVPLLTFFGFGALIIFGIEPFSGSKEIPVVASLRAKEPTKSLSKKNSRRRK